MKPRQVMLHPVLRLVAAGCAALWVAGVVLCDAEHLLEFGGHAAGHTLVASAQHETAAADHHGHPHDADNHHDGDGGPAESHDAEGHEHGPDHDHGTDESCCSTIKTPAPAATLIVLHPPILHPLDFLCVYLEVRELVLTASENASEHPPPDRDRAFTPVVYLGPAVRSQAPPASV